MRCKQGPQCSRWDASSFLISVDDSFWRPGSADFNPQVNCLTGKLLWAQARLAGQIAVSSGESAELRLTLHVVSEFACKAIQRGARYPTLALVRECGSRLRDTKLAMIGTNTVEAQFAVDVLNELGKWDTRH